MAWDDAPPTKDELAKPDTVPWDAMPPHPSELAKASKGPLSKEEIANAPGTGQTALEHGANAASFGYLPQLQAAASKPIYGALNKITGKDVEPDDYVSERDANIRRMQAEGEKNPRSALAGTVGGSAVGALATPVPGLGAGKGLMSAVGRGAAYGAAQGAVSNPGDKEGEVNPIQANERLENTVRGAKTGAAMGAATGLVGKGLSTLANSAENTQSYANAKAIKASGGMLRDFRSMYGRDQVDPIGKFALDRGLVKAGDTVEDVAEKAGSFNKDSGKSLSDIYEKTHSEALANASKDQIEKINQSGFNPVRDKDEILSSIKQSLGKDADKKAAVNSVSDYIDQLIEDHGNKPFTPKEAQEVKTAMDAKVNYSRNPLSKEPGSEKGFSVARKIISKKIDEDVDTIGKASGQSDLLEKLKSANKDYGYSAQLKRMAEDKVARENSNRAFGLTDTIAGGAGSAVGAMMGHDNKERSELGTAGFLGGMVANKLGRKYGPGIQAGAANTITPALRYSAQPVGRLGEQLYTPQVQDALMRSGTETGLLNRKK